MNGPQEAGQRSEAEKALRTEALRRRLEAATPPTRGPQRAPLLNGWRTPVALLLVLVLLFAMLH